MGGYYVNWHNKNSGTKSIVQAQKAQTDSYKISLSHNSYEKSAINGTQQKKSNKGSLVQAMANMQRVGLLKKSFLNKNIVNPVPFKYTLTPALTTSGRHADENKSSKKDVRLAWVLCLIGIIVAVGVLYILPIFFSVALAIISLHFSFKAIKNGNKWIFIIAILDFLIILLAIIIIVALVIDLSYI